MHIHAQTHYTHTHTHTRARARAGGAPGVALHHVRAMGGQVCRRAPPEHDARGHSPRGPDPLHLGQLPAPVLPPGNARQEWDPSTVRPGEELLHMVVLGCCLAASRRGLDSHVHFLALFRITCDL